MKRAVLLVVGVAASALVGIAALTRHPQGNIHRLAPFLVILAVVWIVIVAIGWGRQPAVRVGLAAAGLLAAAYAADQLTLEYGTGECGTVVEELPSGNVVVCHLLGTAMRGAVGIVAAIVLAVAATRAGRGRVSMTR